MYTMIDSEFIRYAVGGTELHRVTIQVDTENDLPTPDDSWEVGSIAIVANTHSYKRLNSEREWV